MPTKDEKLKLGKGAAFVETRLKCLRQENEIWEADFRALPKPVMQLVTKYLGMVVTEPHGFLVASMHVEGRPSVNDLAKLLADAMRRPSANNPHRPTHILLRGHHQWRELFPHLEELGIEVQEKRELPQIEEAYEEYPQIIADEKRKGMVKPTPEQKQVETQFPSISKWINGGFGHIEIGDQEGFGFIARALGQATFGVVRFLAAMFAPIRLGSDSRQMTVGLRKHSHYLKREGTTSDDWPDSADKKLGFLFGISENIAGCSWRRMAPCTCSNLHRTSRGAKHAKHQHARLAHRNLESSHRCGRAPADPRDHPGDGDPRLLAVPQRAYQQPGRQDDRARNSRTQREREVPAD